LIIFKRKTKISLNMISPRAQAEQELKKLRVQIGASVLIQVTEIRVQMYQDMLARGQSLDPYGEEFLHVMGRGRVTNEELSAKAKRHVDLLWKEMDAKAFIEVKIQMIGA
jgi:hypothetical protein